MKVGKPMKDFISIGEILIDLTPADGGKDDYHPHPGGAPANVACVMARLGNSSAFVGKVGDDAFGKLCVRTVAQCGVDTAYIPVDLRHPTTLAVVSLDETGNRSFGFYRDNTADVNLSREDIEGVPFGDYKVFHFGSLSLTAQPSHDTLFAALDKAKAGGCLISYDPNLRMGLWDNAENARQSLRKMMPYAHILKISEEEGDFLFGETEDAPLFAAIRREYAIPMILYTKAEKGSVCSFGGTVCESKAYRVNAVDTTGAGDAFLGGFLHCLLEKGLDPRNEISPEDIRSLLDFGNATGSIVTRKKGAIPAIPGLGEVQEWLERDERID